MRRRAALGAAALVTACASGGGGNPPPPREILRGVEGTERVIEHGRVESAPVTAPPAAVFEAVAAVLDELDLEITTRVPREGRLASEGNRLVRLAGRRASHWVDCGSTLNGPVADAAQVLLSLDVVVTSPGGSVSVLAVRVDAEARARGGLEGVRECTSTGRLEALLTEQVRQRLGDGGGA